MPLPVDIIAENQEIEFNFISQTTLMSYDKKRIDVNQKSLV